MLPKRGLRAVLAFLVALTVQVAHGAPARMAAELRAATCCAGTCHRSRSRTAAAQCCQIGQQDAGVAVVATPHQGARPLAAHVTLAAAPTDGLATAPVPGLAASHVPKRAGPALFLLTRSLRL